MKWIKWEGGECPVDDKVEVVIRRANMQINAGIAEEYAFKFRDENMLLTSGHHYDYWIFLDRESLDRYILLEAKRADVERYCRDIFYKKPSNQFIEKLYDLIQGEGVND